MIAQQHKWDKKYLDHDNDNEKAIPIHNYLLPVVIEHLHSVYWGLLVQQRLQKNRSFIIFAIFVQYYNRHKQLSGQNLMLRLPTLWMTSNMHFCSFRESRRRITWVVAGDHTGEGGCSRMLCCSIYTLISCPSSRLIGSIVTEISDTEKKLLFIQQFCYCDPQLIIDTWKGFHPLTGRVKMHCFCIDWSAIAAGYICPYLLHAWAQIQNSQLQTVFPWNVQNGSFLTKLSLTRGDIPVVCFERLLFNHLYTWWNCNYQCPCL